jgi:hypothetical protein
MLELQQEVKHVKEHEGRKKWDDALLLCSRLSKACCSVTKACMLGEMVSTKPLQFNRNKNKNLRLIHKPRPLTCQSANLAANLAGVRLKWNHMQMNRRIITSTFPSNAKGAMQPGNQGALASMWLPAVQDHKRKATGATAANAA